MTVTGRKSRLTKLVAKERGVHCWLRTGLLSLAPLVLLLSRRLLRQLPVKEVMRKKVSRFVASKRLRNSSDPSLLRTRNH